MKLWQRVFGGGPEPAWRGRARLDTQAATIARLCEQGADRRALPLAVTALADARRVWGAGHDGIVGWIETVAAIQERLGQLRAATALRREAVTLRRVYLGRNHPALLGSVQRLAALYLAQGETAAAQSLLREAAAIQARIYGREQADDGCGLRQHQYGPGGANPACAGRR
ncbi:MAG: tetratricopeptide repeat protein [Chloroflexota bacterium]|nr:tetratricopeptide repeat protein [Chloroflexota bacterium]